MEYAERKRINYIDIMRGIAIISVIVHHCMSTTPAFSSSLLSHFILSFHMPLFFFISGYLFDYKKLGTEKPIYELIGKKTLHLIFPYLMYVSINYFLKLLYEIVNRILGGTYDSSFNFIYQKISLGGMWFLLSLFFTEIIIIVMVIVFRKIKVLIPIMSMLIFAFGLIYSKAVPSESERPIISAFVGIGFFAFGFLMKLLISKFTIFFSKKLFVLIIAIVLGASGVYLSTINTPVLMYLNIYGNLIIFVLTAICGILCIFYISYIIGHCKILEYYGKNTLVILATHFPVYKISGYLLSRVLTEGINTIPLMILYIVIVIFLDTIVIAFINRFIPILAGKIRINERNETEAVNLVERN